MDNFFDPTPDTFTTPSPNLPETDPLREWAAQLNDPEIMKAMASDPQSAINKMIERGVPPPPPEISRYAEGGLGDDRSRTMARPSETFGGAGTGRQPYPLAEDPMTAGGLGDIGNPLTNLKKDIQGAGSAITEMAGSAGDSIYRLLGSTFGPKKADAAAPPPAVAGAPKPTGTYFDPTEVDNVVEENPRKLAPGQVPLPQANPNRMTDVSAQSKPSLSDGLDKFSKSLQGVKAIPPPAPNFVGTPSVRSPGSISAPSIQMLLNQIGQPGPPVGSTLGRLLATGKA